jgi:hypothetical protein
MINLRHFCRAKVLVSHSPNGLGAKDPDLSCLRNRKIEKISQKNIKPARFASSIAQSDLVDQDFGATLYETRNQL